MRSDASEIVARAESVRHQPSDPHASPPPYPTSFGSDFVPPAHYEKFLEGRFPDERGSRIVFHELPHVYVIDGKAYDCSVTTLVKKHCSEFDAKTIIEKMRSSRREAWPRLKYSVDARPATLEEARAATKGVVLVVARASELTLCARLATNVDDLSTVIQRSEARHGEVDLYVAERGMRDDEILAVWDANRIDAASRGTWIHYQLELWSNSLPCHVDNELLNGLKFVGDVLRPLGVRCLATEWEVFGEFEEILLFPLNLILNF